MVRMGGGKIRGEGRGQGREERGERVEGGR